MPEILPVAWRPGRPLPPESIAAVGRAAAMLAGGGIVAIPTETVYGLAAVATNADAVARIFSAKGRPATNPLIVHVADVKAARPLATSWPDTARRLAADHWPGPLTMVLPASPAVPDTVRAGGPTVALRCPEHPVTASLLRILGRPLAAPSANRSGCISPTTASHVAAGLGDEVDLILDGGSCDRGIESTVVDLARETPRVLRPGPISAAGLEASLGCRVEGPEGASAAGRSPGLLPKHYAPVAPLEVVAAGRERVHEQLQQGEQVGWITCGSGKNEPPVAASEPGRLHCIDLSSVPEVYARGLYAALHSLDAAGVDRIIVECPPRSEKWRAIHDRLTRASHEG
jgi:L-threonylcarbamoyladenylate synthase